ncbi:MAG: LPS export ABC transporter periplasmic protein LptC [bacterium]
MSKRLIISGSIIGALILLSLWAFIASSRMADNIKQVSNRPDNTINEEAVFVNDLIITETRDGQKFWEVYAYSGKYDNEQTQALLTNVKGNFYKNNKVILSFEAPMAIYDSKNKGIKLTGGSKALTNNDIFILAKELTWTGNKGDIIAKGSVKIKKADKFSTSGEKCVFNTDFSKFKVIGSSETNVYGKK